MLPPRKLVAGLGFEPRSSGYGPDGFPLSQPASNGALGENRTHSSPRAICFTDKFLSTRSNAKWGSVIESNDLPEGATVFKTACLTINSTLRMCHIWVVKVLKAPYMGQTGGSQQSLTVILAEPSFSRRVAERRQYDPWRRTGYSKTNPCGSHRFPDEPQTLLGLFSNMAEAERLERSQPCGLTALAEQPCTIEARFQNLVPTRGFESLDRSF